MEQNDNDQKLNFYKSIVGIMLKKLGSHVIITKQEYDAFSGTIMHRFTEDGDLEIKVMEDKATQ